MLHSRAMPAKFRKERKGKLIILGGTLVVRFLPFCIALKIDISQFYQIHIHTYSKENMS
jgi:hypothetical protein